MRDDLGAIGISSVMRCVLAGATMIILPVCQSAAQPHSDFPTDIRAASSAVSSQPVDLLQPGRVTQRPAAPALGIPLAAMRTALDSNPLVNDPTQDTPEHTTQSEPTLAVIGSVVCAAYNDAGSGSPRIGFSRSIDSGDQWLDEGLPGPPLGFSDPVLAAHRASNTMYLAQLGFAGTSGPTGSLVSVIGVNRSTDACQSFGQGAIASPSAAPPAFCVVPQTAACAHKRCRQNADCDSRIGAGDGICAGPDMEDKPWIEVDNSGGPRDGAVYACWTRIVNSAADGAASAEIRFSRSIDHGLRFIDDQALSLSNDTAPTGCHITVGAAGEIDVAWSQFVEVPEIHFRRSTDGGITWDPVVRVNSAATRHPGADRIVGCGSDPCTGQPASRPTLNGDIRMLAQAWMATDATGGPFRGNIYVAWAGDPPGDIDNSDVFFSRSTDGGTTWSPQVQIAGGTVTDQFEPFVTVGGNGILSIAWYDRRNDPLHNSLIDVYATTSADGGVTFSPITRLTDVSFPVPPINGQPPDGESFDPTTSACYMGEYIAATADAENFYYAWGDNRLTVTSTAYPDGRPDPDVRFARRSVAAGTPCVGDCDGSNDVTVDEIIIMVNIALGNAQPSACPNGVPTGAEVDVAFIIQAVNNALNGCG